MIRSFLLASFAFLSFGKAFAAGAYGVAPLERLEDVAAWTAQDSARYWVAGETSVFYYDAKARTGRLPIGSGYWTALNGQTYFFYGAHDLPSGAEEILRGGRVRLIASPQRLAVDFAPGRHGGVRPVLRNHKLLETPKAVFRPRSAFAFSDGLDADRWREDVATLSAWNRYSYGSDIGLAQSWLKSEFAALPGFTTDDYGFTMPRGTGYNVIARIEGSTQKDKVYIVGAHYDSTSEKPTTLAPGAEDNASGAAGLLALARLFAAHPPEATMIFVAFSGEEQGLYGSKAWLKETWLKDGTESQIQAVFIMDMIGYSGDSELDVLLETSTLTKPLLADIESVHNDPELVTAQSFNYWGSDHEPFLDNDVPAILFIENDYLGYPSYHRSTDTLDKIHHTLGPKVLRLMADSLALWVYSPAAGAESETGTESEAQTEPEEGTDTGANAGVGEAE